MQNLGGMAESLSGMASSLGGGSSSSALPDDFAESMSSALEDQLGEMMEKMARDVTKTLPEGKRCYPIERCGNEIAGPGGEGVGISISCEGQQANFGKADTIEKATVIVEEKKKADAAAAAASKSHAQALVASMTVVLSAAALI